MSMDVLQVNLSNGSHLQEWGALRQFHLISYGHPAKTRLLTDSLQHKTGKFRHGSVGYLQGRPQGQSIPEKRQFTNKC